jgi:molybdopterin-containing oxidoreductase family membrane subunit
MAVQYDTLSESSSTRIPPGVPGLTAPPAPNGRSPVIAPGYTYGKVTDQIGDVIFNFPIRPGWLLLAGVFFMIVGQFALVVAYLFGKGVGIWGIVSPIFWGFAIINFVWWIGIGHAGTFISAILLLLKQDWRTSINRFAEAMTLFAVACAGMFPLLHLGRPWEFYWLLPYPNTMLLWPQFRSPLVWDCFAISTYFTVSLVFWYVGLIPDLASLRDKTDKPPLKIVFGILSLGWRNSAIHWQRYQVTSILLAGLATPLVLSVHSIVSMDFAGGLVPGWHTTIFPPYFVAGAIFSGFAMVLTLGIPMRKYYHLEGLITMRHLDNCAKLMLTTGLIVAYGYATEVFYGWYSGNIYESFLVYNRAFGPYAWSYWTLIFCNIVTPQLLWSRRVRQNVSALFVISIIVQCGMWLERFVIIVTSLHRDFLPSGWGMYYPTLWDFCIFVGTIGFFFLCFMIFVRILPAISIFEVREQLLELSHVNGADPRWEPGQRPVFAGAATMHAAHSPAGAVPDGGLP